MLTVCTYLWTPDAGSNYHPHGPDDVRLLQRMVARNLAIPHEFVVITDRPEAFAGDAAIRAAPIDWTKHVPKTCFVRLFTFSPLARAVLGERVLRLDIDCVVTGSLDVIVDRDENLVLWRSPQRWWYENEGIICISGFDVVAPRYGFWNGSILLHRTGTLPGLWREFDPSNPRAADDDHYLSDVLGSAVPHWDETHGVYRLEHPTHPGAGVAGALPANARIVFFPGDSKPWKDDVLKHAPWIAQHRH